MSFKIKIETDAKLDIQQTISWYNKKQKGHLYTLMDAFLLKCNIQQVL